MDMHGFYTGQIFDAYKYLGCHITKDGVSFRTFAPNAERVSLLYEGKELPMKKIYDGNFYEIVLQAAASGSTYE